MLLLDRMKGNHMKLHHLLAATFIAVCFLIGCSEKEAPQDSNGKTPQQVLLETYTLIAESQFDKAKENFSPKYIKDFMTSKNMTFIEFHSNEQGIDTRGWDVKWLKTNLVGNDYNDNVWRAKLIVDEGKGAHNRPGVVHDFHIIDGVWKIVFWGDYPKS